MSRNRSNFVRVMGTASAVVLSSTLAMPAVAIAADVNDAELIALEEPSDTDREIAQEIHDAIEDLFQGEEVSYANQSLYTNEEALYSQIVTSKLWDGQPITNTQMNLVDNLDKLKDAHSQFATEKTNLEKAQVAIDKVKEPGLITLDVDAPLVKDARDKYEALGSPLNTMISKDDYARLELAEKRIKELQKTVDEALQDAIDDMDEAMSVVTIDEVHDKKDETKTKTSLIKQDGQTAFNNAKKALGTIWKKVAPDPTKVTIELDGATQQVVDILDKVRGYEKDVATEESNVKDAQRALAKAKDSEKRSYEIKLNAAKEKLAEAQEKLSKEEAKKSMLSETQQELYSTLYEYNELNEAISAEPSDEVVKLIDKINDDQGTTPMTGVVSIAKLTLADEENVNKAVAAYDNLTTNQKYIVDNTAKKLVSDWKAGDYLRKAKDRIDALKGADEDHQKAAAVEQQIAALPALEDLTYGDKAAVEAARAAYDALTDAQKALVNEDLVKALEAAEKRIEELKPVLTAQVYRLYNNYSGEHFYTADESEKDALVAIGWVNETDEKNSWWSADETGDPVYRLYNPNADGGDHHYTMSTEEVDALVALGWQKDNDGKPVFFSADDEFGVPVYRAYNGNAEAHNHNYTASLDEQTALVKAGWTGEGIAFYGMPLLKDAE